MRVLVLGATGMLGHKVLQVLSQRFEAYGTVRSGKADVAAVAPGAAAILDGVSATELGTVVAAFAKVRPDAVVNCIGIVKQLEAAKDPIISVRVNSLFPHELRAVCSSAGARLIHVSTDCVFSGGKGGYTEDDIPDPIDLYGRSKLLGEPAEEPALTIRTSIIGRELEGAHGLVEWFLNQDGGSARGFRRAVFSGWTTGALARALGDVLETQPSLTGLWHVAAAPIAKYDLLTLLRDAFDLDVAVEPDDDVVIDRSLDGSRFTEATGIKAPSWDAMVEELRSESPLYDEIRERAFAER